jgi:hypothetical protein
MKSPVRIFLVTAAFLVFNTLCAQEKPQYEALKQAEEEEAPLIFSFAPAFSDEQQKEREALEIKISTIDTLDIPESRKYTLIRDLYRKRDSRRLQKAFLAETEFQEEEEIDP